MFLKLVLSLGLLAVAIGAVSARPAGATSPRASAVASAGAAKMLCEADGGNLNIRTKPKSCEFTCATCDPFQAGTYIVHLRWTGWGRSTTRAKGTYRGNMNASAPASIRLSRLVGCYNGYRYYSRARMVIDGHATNFTLPTCL